jgi:hypothetical protein
MKKLILSIPIFLLFMHLMFAHDGTNEWTLVLDQTGAIWQDCIKIHPTNNAIIYVASNVSGIWKSTNYGLNFTNMNNGLLNLTVQTLAISKSNPSVLYCGTSNVGSNNGMYKTTDGGANWTLINNGIVQTPIGIQATEVDPTNPDIVYTTVWDGSTTINSTDGLYKTTNGGATWFVSNTGIVVKNLLSLIINPLRPSTVYAGSSFIVGATNTGPSFVYKSYNAGATWTSFSTGLPTAITDICPVRSMSMSTIDTSRILAGLFMNTTNGGAYFTANGGTSWTKIHNASLPNVTGTNIRSSLIKPGSNTEFFLGLDGTGPNGVFRSTDAGATWASFSSGVLSAAYVVRSLAFGRSPDSTLFAGVAGTAGQGVYGYSWVPVGIGLNNNIPKEYALHQNFPNPFNPATNISYDLPHAGNVQIDVYDLTGRFVKSLVNDYKQSGSYSVTFDATNLSSGIYIYKIITSSFTDAKKMILVK